MPEIIFVNENITISVEAGITILQAAKFAGVIIEAPCNAMGTCGKCKVQIDSPASDYVLACKTRVYENIKVITQNSTNVNQSMKIHSEGESFSYPVKSYITKITDGIKTKVYAGTDQIGIESGDTTDDQYGLVIDIGTTTLVAALINLLTGEEITSVSSLNPQSRHAQDVLTRIHFASEGDGLQVLYNEITEEFNRMIDSLAKETGIIRENIYEVIYSGNTAMIHIATNVNPSSLGKFPYTPTVLGGSHIQAQMLHISSFGLIYLPNIISAYVGPDITSGVLASQLDQIKGIVLFIDIGTNGEMVISKNGIMHATSTAAGPAFEGMNISCGMRAGNGAIESFQIKEDKSFEVGVIGDIPGTGICGSGLMDIVGELVRTGVIVKTGKIVAPDSQKISQLLADRIFQQDGKNCFEITEKVYLTQKDIRQVQLAKGAIRAGIEALLKKQNILADEVDRVEIAGSFGYHLREQSLLDIGLLPVEFKDKVKFVGNTSKSGGIAFLLNTDLRERMKKVIGEVGKVELSNSEGFDKLFVDSLNF